MAKVFKDKENTIAEVARIEELVETFKVRFPAYASAARYEVELINHDSQMAHNSTMHNEVFTQVSKLRKWIDVICWINRLHDRLKESDLIKEKVTEQYPLFGSIYSDIQHQFQFPPTKAVSWTHYNAVSEKAYHSMIELNNYISNINRSRHAANMASLDIPMEAGKPITKQQHDAFKWLLDRHDYYYDYSDDQTVWRRGVEESKRIKAIADSHPHYLSMHAVMVYANTKGAVREEVAAKYEKLREAAVG